MRERDAGALAMAVSLSCFSPSLTPASSLSPIGAYRVSSSPRCLPGFSVKAGIRCQADHDNNAPVTRRGVVIGFTAATMAVGACSLLPVHEEANAAGEQAVFLTADAGVAGAFSKYLKRKKLDPLDTYIPTVLLAQLQFQDVGGKLVGEQPAFSDARSLLRSGPAGSLRTDIRAVAQYAAEAGDGKVAADAVDQCLSALEDLDSLLIRAARSESSASVETMKVRISTAVTALDRLLATVPSPILEKGKAIATAYREERAPSDSNSNADEPDLLKGLL